MAKHARGTIALLGGGEWRPACRDLDAELLERSGGTEVVVLPTAAAFEHPDRVVERATGYFRDLGATVRALPVLRRADADDKKVLEGVDDAGFVYIADGSPLHLRSALKESKLFESFLHAYRKGAVVAASGAGATVVCDPMVDPRGGAYTVGLGLVEGLAVFPYHGTAADHLRERSIDLLPSTATLVGIDEETALIRDAESEWRVAGAGAVTLYDGRDTTAVRAGSPVPQLTI
jgi:cyanophycinase